MSLKSQAVCSIWFGRMFAVTLWSSGNLKFDQLGSSFLRSWWVNRLCLGKYMDLVLASHRCKDRKSWITPKL